MPRITETGHSDVLSFDEAFKNAVERISPKVPDDPDFLLRVVVTEIRGDFGSIAGLTRLSVTIAADV
jgi:hypothetical protein